MTQQQKSEKRDEAATSRDEKRRDDEKRDDEKRDESRDESRELEGRPLLASGDAHPAVHELGHKLADAGYETSTSRGENPFGHVDESIIAAVRGYTSDRDLSDDDRRQLDRGTVPLSVWSDLG